MGGQHLDDAASREASRQRSATAHEYISRQRLCLHALRRHSNAAPPTVHSRNVRRAVPSQQLLVRSLYPGTLTEPRYNRSASYPLTKPLPLHIRVGFYERDFPPERFGAYTFHFSVQQSPRHF